MQEKIFTVPRNYPLECSDDDIAMVISQMAQIMIDSGADINQTLRFGPMIAAGQIESQRRITAKDLTETEELKKQINKLKQISEENTESSKLFAMSSKRLSIVALVISIISLLFSFAFSFYNAKSSGDWQKEQFRILKEIANKKF